MRMDEVSGQIAGRATDQQVRDAANSTLGNLDNSMRHAIEGDFFGNIPKDDHVQRALLLRHSIDGLITAAQRRGMKAEAKKLRKKLTELEGEIVNQKDRIEMLWFKMVYESGDFSIRIAPELRKAHA